MTRERPEPNCAGQSGLFTSVAMVDHLEAKRLCLGGPDSSPCLMLAACRESVREFQASQWQSGLHGTWAGVLYGKKLAAAEEKERRGRAKPREHGSDRGYYQHRYLKEEACAECLEAHRFQVWLRNRYGVSV